MRRNRGNYALRYLASMFVIAFLNIFMERAEPVLSALLMLVFTIICLFLAIGRFKDMNMNPWWSLLTLLPLVSFVIMFIPGTKGENRYGVDPAQFNAKS